MLPSWPLSFLYSLFVFRFSGHIRRTKQFFSMLYSEYYFAIPSSSLVNASERFMVGGRSRTFPSSFQLPASSVVAVGSEALCCWGSCVWKDTKERPFVSLGLVALLFKYCPSWIPHTASYPAALFYHLSCGPTWGFYV